MARAYYHYTLNVLEKVSFDAPLFTKELKKAYRSFLPQERLELDIWLQKFLLQKPDLLAYLQQSNEFSRRDLFKAS